MQNEYNVEYETLNETADYIINSANTIANVIEEISSVISSTTTDAVFAGPIANSVAEGWDILKSSSTSNIENLKNINALKSISSKYKSTDSSVAASHEVI